MGRNPLNHRLRGMGTTIFAEMSALAVATGSVNLGQGFPDTDGPAEIAEAAVAAIRAGHNQYPPGAGIPELRNAIAEHQKRFYGLAYDPDTEVLVTAGATEAIAAAMLALVEPDDEVIALEPYYDSYAACIAMAGGVRVPVTLRPPDFALDVDALRAKANSPLAEVWLHGKLLYVLMLERRMRRQLGDRWGRLDHARVGTWWRVWGMLKDETAPMITGALFWKEDAWAACLKVLAERPRRRKLQQLPPAAIDIFSRCNASKQVGEPIAA